MSEKKTSIPLTELDKQTYCGPAQMLKAAVSYMDPSSGKMLAMLARMMEFRQTLELFEKEQISICSLSGGNVPALKTSCRISVNTALLPKGNRLTSF